MPHILPAVRGCPRTAAHPGPGRRARTGQWIHDSVPRRRHRAAHPGGGPDHAAGRPWGPVVSLFRDDGVVLRTRKLGEADRIMLFSPGGRPPYPRPETRGGRS
ncbi:hypothetical protein GCM10009544_19430 [Streptomyces stramineus]|uniref:DNA replication/recombination mediator RecO N-terminal domain-containing protein n=1 Tax=Streptomyces stramineus TaxID=173861 RepID=A0ABP3JKR4_9ACTN